MLRAQRRLHSGELDAQMLNLFLHANLFKLALLLDFCVDTLHLSPVRLDSAAQFIDLALQFIELGAVSGNLFA